MSPEEEQIRGNLPQELNSFVGRERELDELCRLVGTARALTLSGVGGIGKTRLALRVLAAVAGDFPDGVWFVELGDLRQPELVVSRLASVIGVDEERGRPLVDTLADALRPRRLLIALDNCEHLIDTCAGVSHRLLAGAPGLRLIATSREPLRVAAERVWQVPPLSVPPAGTVPAVGAIPLVGVVSLVDPASSASQAVGQDAVSHDAAGSEAIRLFADRAAAAHPGFTIGPANAAAAAALCRALDGMPLAIELAAAWVRVLSVEQIAERLADRFRLLTTGGRTAPPRQRTLRATIDWSHELLTVKERVLLRRLSVFAGWSLEMAERVCSDDEIAARDMLDLIAALVDKSLVVVDPEALGQARYRLLDTIREYAAERLADAGESETFQRRLRDYTLGVAERNMAVGMAQIPAPWSARVDVFRRYDVDVGNVRQVLSRCLAQADAETGMRICTAVRPCWIVRGAFAEGGEWLDSFLALDAPPVPPAVLGPALVGRAQLALSADPHAAASWAEEGLELCRIAGDAFWEAVALNLLSEIALHTGRIEEAESFADKALYGAQATGDGWNEGYALGTRAAIAAQRGGLREAHQLAKTSIAVMRRIDQQWGVARTLLGLGDLARLRGDPGEAQSMYLEALAILREVDARPEIARCLAGLGRVAMDRGAAGHAKQYLAESLRLSHSTGSRIGVARGLESFAALAVKENRPERAVQLAAAATALRETAGLPALSGARIERYLAPARRLGEPAVGRLWARGTAMASDAAVALALEVREPAAVAGRGAVAGADEAAATVPGTLTPRERQIVALVVNGRSNRAIAEELFISPATAARHIANILAKLGFTSRTQIAAWAVGQDLDLIDPATGDAPAKGA
jgi:predicted ATPase/DNA-binding CsgD family transcriptional regulator